jgi:transcription elongation factor Elf1
MCKIFNFGGQVIRSSLSTELDMKKNFTCPLLGAERVAAVSAKGRTALLQHQLCYAQQNIYWLPWVLSSEV